MHDPLNPHDPTDIDLQKTPPISRAPAAVSRQSPALWIAAVVVLVVAGAAAAYLLLAGRDTPDPGTTRDVALAGSAPTDAERPLGPDVEPIELPPLDESDALVRTLVQALSSHPRVAAWLATDHLIRNFTVVVDNIATGETPARHLGVFRPADPFEVTARETGPIVNPASYERYTPVAAAIDSIDPQGAARLYATLKPRIEEASRELGRTEPFDRTLERAILVLLNTPAVDATARLVPEGGTYRYAEPSIEALSAAQKQFARMGPRNVRAVQAKLQAIALALGIQPERLSN